MCSIDDVRRFNQMQRAAIPLPAAADTVTSLRRMFCIFEPPAEGRHLPQLSLWRLPAPSPGGVEIVPIPLFHGVLSVLGSRVATSAYRTDWSRIPDESFDRLDGVGTLIIDALRHRPHSTHFSVTEACEAAARIGATRTFFTHISHDLGHAATCATLPAGVELAYDGLVLEIQ